MPTRTKTPIEQRIAPIDLAQKMSEGASLVSARAFASREVTLSTTVAANSAANDTTISLNADPGIGAQLTINGGGATGEIFKVENVTGSSPWVCTIVPAAMYAHNTSESAVYEPGVSARLLTDTTPPVDASQVLPMVRRGAAKATTARLYRISVLGLCDNGEEVEGEFDLEVLDIVPTEIRVKQPSETRDHPFDFAQNLGSATLVSVVGYASHVATLSTTLNLAASAEAATLELVAHPGIGARLVVNPSGPNEEVLYVSAVSGVGPYVATIHPTTEFAHSGGETVSYDMGESTRILVSTTPTPSGSEAVFRSRRGDSGERYRLSAVAPLSSGEILQHTGFLDVTEV